MSDSTRSYTDLSLADIFRRKVLDNWDVQWKRAELQAHMARARCAAEPHDVRVYVAVRYEDWAREDRERIVALLALGFPLNDKHLSGFLKEKRKALNALGCETIKALINQFRDGDLVAAGLETTPSQDLNHATISEGWWSQPDKGVSFCENRLLTRIEGQWQPQFSEVRVREALEKGVPPGSTLMDALDAIADPPDREALHHVRTRSKYEVTDISAFGGAPESPESKAGRDKYGHYSKLDQEDRERLRVLLIDGRLRLLCLPSITAEPVWLPTENVALVELNFEDSTVALPESTPTVVRVYPADEIPTSATASAPEGNSARSKARTYDDESASKEKPRRPGRPSRGGEVVAAWNRLIEGDRIDCGATQREAIQAVRAEVLRLAPNGGTDGLGHEAIRKRIADKFQAEKEKRSKDQKL